jgi:hypothetical protein
MRMVTVEYGPQLVNGSAIFLAFKLGVTDIYSKTLPTVALQKTASRRTTVAGALLTHAASRWGLASRIWITVCRHLERHRRTAELEQSGRRDCIHRSARVDLGRLRACQNQLRHPIHVRLNRRCYCALHACSANGRRIAISTGTH